MNDFFQRLNAVAGDEMMDILQSCRVAIFGVGGVGSWCAEALARTAIGHITIIDPDNVAPSNINRQLPATSTTIGLRKVDVVAERLRLINPTAEIIALATAYTPENANSFDIETFDYVIDAIDSLSDKANLILRCTDPATAPKQKFFSSMGAARKIDPTKVATTEFWNVEGCALARALRTRFRRQETYPKRKFKCVFSPEQLPSSDPAVNGTFAHLTATFGITMASLVIRDIYDSCH